MVEFVRNAKVAKDDDKDKDVVDTQCVLDQVTREKLQAMQLPECVVNPDAEKTRKNDPHQAPDCRFPDFDRVSVAMEYPQIDRQEKKDDGEKYRPE
jgi:hypothetical protein